MSQGPDLNVILCTYNPDPELFKLALGAIQRQTLSATRFDLTIVDNNSAPPLYPAEIAATVGRRVRVLREQRQGLTFARACGLAATSASLVCFVDDDNELAPDYLERALEIGAREPDLGAFGGVAEGALARSVGPLKTAFLPHLGVRDLGASPLTGGGDSWGPWEPIGAGLCLRREVACGYLDFVENHDIAAGLGRRGAALLSGEDSLISRIAHYQGYRCGYRPELRLRHHITEGRLTFRYMAKILAGHGRSHVLLQRIVGAQLGPIGRRAAAVQLVRNFVHRMRTEGPRTALGMFFWDRGYFAERNRADAPVIARPLGDMIQPQRAAGERAPAMEAGGGAHVSPRRAPDPVADAGRGSLGGLD